MLWAVKRSPTGRSPRMSELAEWLTLSRGGITKLVDRLDGNTWNASHARTTEGLSRRS